MKAQRPDFGLKKQSLEETIMSANDCDHINIPSTLCKTIKPFLWACLIIALKSLVKP